MIAPPARTKCCAFSAWWSPVANGYGTRHRGPARGRDLPDGRAGTREHQVDGRERRAEAIGLWQNAVVVAPNALAHAREVSLAGDVENRRACLPPGVHDEIVDRARSCERAEDTEHVPILWKLEDRACILLRDRYGARRDRTADDTRLPAIPVVDRIGEEESACERSREPVRETEVRIGLRERRWNAKRRRSEDHRTGDETTTAEDDVRAPPPQDRAAGVRRRTGEQQRTGKRDRRPPRKALYPEGIELVARIRNELRFDPIRRPGERHEYAPLRQRFCDRERRQHVTCRPAGRDQTPKLLLHRHDERC